MNQSLRNFQTVLSLAEACMTANDLLTTLAREGRGMTIEEQSRTQSCLSSAIQLYDPNYYKRKRQL